MRKRTKLLATGMLSIAMVAPNVALAAENTTANIESNSDININLQRKSVVLGSKSNASVKFKEKLNADSITLNFMCYDMPLEATLNYNEKTDAYEGVINYNKDPEYLNVWELQSIKVNGKDEQKVLNKEDLESMGLNLKDYDVTQEFIISDANSTKAVNEYMRKTSAPVKKLAGATRFETAVEISKQGWKDGASKVVIVNGELAADGITATPLASTYDAPILLANKDDIPESTKAELKRLNPSDVIIIGDDGSVSQKAVSQIKSAVDVNVTRIGGVDRHETSLLIAKEIDKYHDVNKIYIANGYAGEYDALNISSKAGEDQQPIILANKDSVPESTYNWLSSQGLEEAYYIGGDQSLSSKLIDKISKIAKNGTSKNRVSGADRHETNAKVIKTFYPDKELSAMLVAKSDIIVDSITAGPLAAKLKSPILITPKTYVSAYHSTNLSEKTAGTVYQIGDGMKDSVINSIASSLSKHNAPTEPENPGSATGKTVVIDPGHGGSDSGATSGLNGGAQEKKYTLNTALATTEYLRSKGINVVMTRDTDKTMALGERTTLSNTIKPDLFTSIHYNASNGAGNGVEIFYKVKDKNGGTTKTAASNILKRILEKFNMQNRGIKTRTLANGNDYLYVLRNNNYPAILVECAFIDNKSDMDKLNTAEKVKTMGTQIGIGIEDTVK